MAQSKALTLPEASLFQTHHCPGFSQLEEHLFYGREAGQSGVDLTSTSVSEMGKSSFLQQ